MTMRLIDLRVLELLTARLCHDLIGPVAAIANGVELLGEDEAPLGVAERDRRPAQPCFALLQAVLGSPGPKRGRLAGGLASTMK